MKKLILIATVIVFIGMNIFHLKGSEPNTVKQPDPLPKVEQSYFVNHSIEIPVGITYPVVNLTYSFLDKTVYYVKIGNTISKLEDKEGYIIAAKRLGMESIMIIPDGKVYRTVSLDLHKDDKELKSAIEVKLDEIIIAD